MDFAEILQTVNNPTVIAGLFAAATILILIDFYFPVDWPAHIGYAAFGAGVFLVLHLSVVQCAVAGVGAFVLLEIMHYVLFSRYLTNAPGTAGYRGDKEPTSSEAGE